MYKSRTARRSAKVQHAMFQKSKGNKRFYSQERSADPVNRHDNDDKLVMHRAKNRAAAAKCRAMKKENIEVLDTRHQREQANNNFLTRHIMALRDELS